MRALTPAFLRRAAAALLTGVAVGLLTRAVGGAATPLERAAAAVALVLALAPCLGALPLAPSASPSWAQRGRSVSGRAAAAGVCGLVAVLVAGGGLGAAPAALVPVGAVALAAGAAWLARSLGADVVAATLIGAAAPLVLAASIFAADPFIEWDGPGPSSATRAAWVLRANPLASATGAVGVDLSSRGLLYDGPGHGAEGFSVIGQYYPSRPAPAAVWGGLAALLGGLLLLVPYPATSSEPRT